MITTTNLLDLRNNIKQTLQNGYIEMFDGKGPYRLELPEEKRRKLKLEYAALEAFSKRVRSGFETRYSILDNKLLQGSMRYTDWLKILIKAI